MGWGISFSFLRILHDSNLALETELLGHIPTFLDNQFHVVLVLWSYEDLNYVPALKCLKL